MWSHDLSHPFFHLFSSPALTYGRHFFFTKLWKKWHYHKDYPELKKYFYNFGYVLISFSSVVYGFIEYFYCKGVKYLHSLKATICNRGMRIPWQWWKPHIGASGKIALNLCSVIPTNQSFKLFFENWFFGIDLQVQLEGIKFHSVGTVKSSRLPNCTFTDDQIMKKKRKSDLWREGNKTRWCKPESSEVAW